MRILFTAYAERQLDELHAYTSQASFEQRADAYLTRLIEFCLGLERFPLRGTPRDDVVPGLRTVVFERRVTVAYLVDPECVVIEGIYARGRDIRAGKQSA